jgi:serine/threonine-protein kinase
MEGFDASSSIAHYRITAKIGQGGMGEVYRATDTKLGRQVAIKVLPETFAQVPDRLTRFTREARVLASLNHPNIAAIYGVEERALIMELVEGPTLAERIAQGAIPVDEALAIARELSEALEYAHDRGVVHRDLKPANIKVDPDGHVKVLDFGLAKAMSSEPASGEPISAPTVTAEHTVTGLVLGTPAYMSPEQARGRPADRRADIWAFGVVLLEMLTGRRLPLAMLIASDQDLGGLPAGTPAVVERLLHRCLEKDPRRRLQAIGEARLLIEEALAGPSAEEKAAAPAPLAWWQSGWAWLAAAVAMAAACAAVWFLKPAPPVTRVVGRFELSLPEGQAFTRTGRHMLAISPEGAKFVYVANKQLYVRAMNELDAQPVRGTSEDPMEPVFSPDGQWLAYFTPVGGAGSSNGAWTLKKIAVAGGGSITLAQLPAAPFGATWRNGTIAFGLNSGGATVQAVPDSGGALRTLATADAAKEFVSQPQLLDDGKHLLFVLRDRGGTEGEGRIVVQALDGKDRRTLVNGGSDPRVLPTGQLLYIHDATLLAVPFDRKRLAVTGGPVPVMEGVRETNTTWAGQFAVSSTGTLVFWPGSAQSATAPRSLVWVDRDGHEQPIPAKARPYGFARLSPDGKKIAVTSADEENDIWTFDLANEALTRVTSGPAYEWGPVWTSDGKYLFFSSSPVVPAYGVHSDVYRKASDGTGTTEALTERLGGGDPRSLAPDGRSLVYMGFSPQGAAELFLLPLDPKGPPRGLFPDVKFYEYNAGISPDGRWLAYDSNESGQWEVYVRPFPAVDSGRWQISSEGGTRPLWSRSGRELFFLNAAKRMAVVAVQPGAAFAYAKAQLLFDATHYTWGGDPFRYFDISADGKRFLMIKNPDATSDAATHPSIVVVSNWFDELRVRMPAHQ